MSRTENTLSLTSIILINLDMITWNPENHYTTLVAIVLQISHHDGADSEELNDPDVSTEPKEDLQYRPGGRIGNRGSQILSRGANLDDAG
jgi:hypothetical protein